MAVIIMANTQSHFFRHIKQIDMCFRIDAAHLFTNVPGFVAYGVIFIREFLLSRMKSH